MRIALDTNRYCDLVSGDAALARLLEMADAVYVPFVVVGELRAGFAAGGHQGENEALLRRMLSRDGVEVLYASDQTTHHYAALYAQLRRAGTPIPTNDLWIAALTLEHDLTLCSRDEHFARLPQLTRI